MNADCTSAQGREPGRGDEGLLRAALCEVGRRMWQRGFVAGNDGNLSARLGASRLLATPTGVSKGFMAPQQLVVLDLDGSVLEGEAPPSSEILMHLAVYAERPDVQAVVHGHPPVATGFAAARRRIPTEILTEATVVLGEVAITDYATPGTPEVPGVLQPHLRDHDFFLLANHGVLVLGPDLWEAYHRLEQLESCAHVAVVAAQIGGGRAISYEQLARLRQIRRQQGREPGCSAPEPRPAT